jgi:GNAT superfamily N-acetyltransferase
VATAADLPVVVDTLVASFEGDPLWRWVFPDMADLEVMWRLYAASGLRYPWVRMLDGAAAVAIWIPPGGTELTELEEIGLEPLLRRLVGGRACAVLELLENFEAAHPRERPHYHLTLLGTHPDHRGKGIGMGLLADCLGLIDAEGMPAYLESSNPANDTRYERIGFRKIGAFSTPDGTHTVATMWREPQVG